MKKTMFFLALCALLVVSLYTFAKPSFESHPGKGKEMRATPAIPANPKLGIPATPATPAHKAVDPTIPPEFVLSWGSLGSGNGQFWGSPYAVDTNSQGNVYVLDDYRIQKFSNTGVFVAKTERGTGGSGLAIDSQDNVYVVNRGIENTVKKFDGNLNLLGIIYQKNNDLGFGFGNIAIDSNDNLFITARWKMIKMDANGNIIKEWGSNTRDGLEGVQFAEATGVAVDLENNVYVSDITLHNIQVFDNDGNLLRTFGGPGDGDNQFRTPVGLAFDSNNYLYVAEYYGNKVKKLTKEGAYLTEWGSSYGNPGSAPGEFYAPGDVTVGSDGSVYVVEHGNYRIQKFK